ncbi:CynX/NimT family MFS transporter [Sphingobacterium spiritivorum]|uniref:CynX/NimT family MFS transporter n=1 Tax=Sphingobacterium spiritivorum TaxID=258 RepID=UPI001917B354|nr:MFS transporter [Sphingobacterium spiritivorum]QQT25482.1 MFS transporter [Sphingobacterium spiritivorum]
MQSELITSSKKRSRIRFEIRNPYLRILSFLGVIFVATNLRSPLSAVGPVMNEIINVLHLSNIEAGLLTAVPLAVFAGLSSAIGQFAIKYKMEKLILISLLVLIVGLWARISGNNLWLFTGSALVGIGICVSNVLMPAFIKKNFPEKVGVMTGIYSVAMNLSAALAAGLSISIGRWTQSGWQGSLGIWIIPAALTLMIWLPQLFNVNASGKPTVATSSENHKIAIFKSRQAWNISIFMGLQSLMYYSIAAWLPAVLMDYGMDTDTAGWVLFYFQLAMLPVTFLGPVIASKMKQQGLLIWILSFSMLAGLILIIVFRLKFIYPAVVLFGLANGLSFSLSMLFFSLRTEHAHTAIQISGMSQSIGYLIAAFGPPVFGKLYDITRIWNASFYFLIITVLLMLIFGLYAAKDRSIESDFKNKN